MAEPEQKKENSYRSILKGTSIFGGVQIFQVLISLIRGKFVAMLLGPEGMGINSLFVSSSNTVSQVSNLGLSLAIVKETAEVKDEPGKLSQVACVSMSIIRIAALLGMIFCVLFAPWLSQVTFGTEDYSLQFMLLGAVVFLMVTSGGMSSLLQGMHKVKVLARSTIVGSLTGLLCGVPLYYFIGVRGIVPALLLTFLSQTIYYRLALNKVLPGNRERFSWQSHKPLVRKLVTLGLLLMASTMISTLCGYGVNVLLRVMGDVNDVGLYNAANSLTNQYSAMVFTAMSLDYFPRLTGVAHDNVRMAEVVNRQEEVVAMLVAPIAIMVIMASPLIIRVLLASEFMAISPLVRWMAVGVVLKAMAFPMGYIAFAKDNKKLFFWLEGVTGNLLYLAMAVGGYYLFGLIGMGYAMVVENALLILIYYVVNRVKFGYRFSARSIMSYIYAVLLAGSTFVGLMYVGGVAGWIVAGVCLLLSGWISARNIRTMLSK